MSEIVYWIPIRTIAGTEKDKICKCSKCDNVINKYDLEQLRFMYCSEPQIYENAIKEEYYICSKCGSEMNMHVTCGIIENNLALGDRNLNNVIQGLINEVKLQDDSKLEGITEEKTINKMTAFTDESITKEEMRCER